MIIIYKIELTREQFYITYHVLGHAQGRRHGFENGGDNFASGASKKNFWPLHFLASGGQNIAYIAK